MLASSNSSTFVMQLFGSSTWGRHQINLAHQHYQKVGQMLTHGQAERGTQHEREGRNVEALAVCREEAVPLRGLRLAEVSERGRNTSFTPCESQLPIFVTRLPRFAMIGDLSTPTRLWSSEIYRLEKSARLLSLRML